jgi:hypothetical protein
VSTLCEKESERGVKGDRVGGRERRGGRKGVIQDTKDLSSISPPIEGAVQIKNRGGCTGSTSQRGGDAGSESQR